MGQSTGNTFGRANPDAVLGYDEVGNPITDPNQGLTAEQLRNRKIAGAGLSVADAIAKGLEQDQAVSNARRRSSPPPQQQAVITHEAQPDYISPLLAKAKKLPFFGY